MCGRYHEVVRMSDYGTGDPYGTGWKYSIPVTEVKFDFSPTITSGPSTEEMLQAILWSGVSLSVRTAYKADQKDAVYVTATQGELIKLNMGYEDLDDAIESIYSALVALGHIEDLEKD